MMDSLKLYHVTCRRNTKQLDGVYVAARDPRQAFLAAVDQLIPLREGDGFCVDFLADSVAAGDGLFPNFVVVGE